MVDIIVATDEHVAARAEALGDRATAGPDVSKWSDGWWSTAGRKPAHAQRVGGAISPWAVVVHTTDMVPEEWKALVNAWTTRPGDGACAHFLIGRSADEGVVQFVPIHRNGNHAGGPEHGVFDTAAARAIHPNLVAVGIELHCAGGLRKVNGAWRFMEAHVVHGAPIPEADVIVDEQRPDRGWHVVTDYQRDRLSALLVDLELVLAPLPAGAACRATGKEAVPAWGVPRSARVVGHVSLDPANRADPWRPTCSWLFKSG